MTVNFKYPLQPNTVVPTIGIGEAATGRELIDLYAGDVANGGNYILSDNPFYAENGFTLKQSASFAIAFDLTIEKTLIIDGRSIVNVPFILSNTAGTSQNYDASCAIVVSKVDANNNETALVTDEHSITFDNISAGTASYAMLTFYPDIPRTSFKSGEKFRIRYLAPKWGGTEIFLLHDPKNRSNTQFHGGPAPLTTVTSQLIIKTPFVTQ